MDKLLGSRVHTIHVDAMHGRGIMANSVYKSGIEELLSEARAEQLSVAGVRVE